LKEVVEYVLAGIIILSIIPVYDYIVNNLYTPPDITVDYSLLNTLALRIKDVLEEQFVYGNASSPIFSFDKYVEERLGYILSGYAYRVEVVSSSIKSIALDESANTLLVETVEPGTLNLFLIVSGSSGLGFVNVTVSSYSSRLVNGTYTYTVSLTSYGVQADSLLYVVAVLETTSYKYIGYLKASDLVQEVGFTDNAGVAAVVIPSNSASEPVINTTLVFYAESLFYAYSNATYTGLLRVTGNSLVLRNNTVQYQLVNSTQLSYSGRFYTIYNLTLLVDQRIIRIRFRGDGTGTVEDISRNTYRNGIESPLYNLLLAVFRDSSGRVYVARWYPHSVVFGKSIPRDLPFTKITLVLKLGLFDYSVTVYLWRLTV